MSNKEHGVKWFVNGDPLSENEWICTQYVGRNRLYDYDFEKADMGTAIFTLLNTFLTQSLCWRKLHTCSVKRISKKVTCRMIIAVRGVGVPVIYSAGRRLE